MADFGRILAGIMSGGISEIPGVRSGFDKLMGQGKYDPASKAMPYLNQAQDQYLPYQQQGQAAYNQLNPVYSQMTQDPAAYLEQLMGGYEPSKTYQTHRDEALNAIGNTAAAGGMRGSPQDIINSTRLSDSLLGSDMQQWLQNVMGLQGMGLQGQQHFYDTGVGATSDIANILGSKGGLSFQSQSQQNQRAMDLLNSLIKGGTSIAGGMAGGGAGAASSMGGGSEFLASNPRAGMSFR